jgi:hypothetical protein
MEPDTTTNQVIPALATASEEGRLQVTTAEALASAAGVPLTAAANPVLVVLAPPIRSRKRTRRPVPAASAPEASGSPPVPLFEAAEHIFIGNDATLFFEPGAPGVSAATMRLPLPNGLALRFGEILSMGDFYGLPDAPISDGNDHESRFVAAFNTLGACPSITVS